MFSMFLEVSRFWGRFDSPLNILFGTWHSSDTVQVLTGKCMISTFYILAAGLCISLSRDELKHHAYFETHFSFSCMVQLFLDYFCFCIQITSLLSLILVFRKSNPQKFHEWVLLKGWMNPLLYLLILIFTSRFGNTWEDVYDILNSSSIFLKVLCVYQ